MIFTPR